MGPVASAPKRNTPQVGFATTQLTVPDAEAWRAWLADHHGDPGGVWLVLAKKDATHPTSLTYDQALDEALCYGWIDGQVRRADATTYRQRFTPRTRRSAWSQRNVGIVERLIASGRMQPAGLAAVEAAQTDGRWAAAYAGAATIEIPPDLAVALAGNPPAQAMFDVLSGQNRYAVLYRIGTAKTPATRARRIAKFVAMLARGDTVHPQKRGVSD
jgi:uncharacterized protein YdeI (YjbR/CyaY-like superfamily)